MNVLLADDERMLRHYLKALLKRWGAEVHTARSAADALDHLKHTDYDLLLLDLRLSDHDALWLLDHASVPGHTRIVVMTAFAPTDVERRLRQRGVGDILTKPFSPEQLMDLLERHKPPPPPALVPLAVPC